MQSTGEVKFSNTSYTIHVRARSLNLSLGQIIIESIPRPCSAKISRCHIHDVTVHLRGNSALQPQTFPQHYIHGVAICACSSTAASSLHYILVVGLWQRRNSSFRKTHTFGTCYVDTVTCYVDTVYVTLSRARLPNTCVLLFKMFPRSHANFETTLPD